MARNLSQLTYLNCIAEYSCLKTLAGKWKTSIAKVRRKLNHPLGWGIKYNLQPQKAKVELWDNFSWGRIKRMRNYKGKIAEIAINPNLFKGRTKLTDRLAAQKCEVCQLGNQLLEIHHVGTIRDSNWRSVMNKKTTVLCQVCHRKRTNQQMYDIKIFEKNKRSRISI
ncbi:MAG: hypothetical protein RCH30_4650 [Candidatus Phytoplasma australasiaticum]|nr:MAG: hypothetical protein RCH30_4650 [Candidatus Phytoplasma australasiaticum]